MISPSFTLAGAALVAGLVIGGTGAWKFQANRIDGIKADHALAVSKAKDEARAKERNLQDAADQAQKKPTPFVSNGTLLVVMLIWLLTGCAGPTVAPEPVRLPALPPSAKQPIKPPTCEPRCLDALTNLRERSADLLTTPTKPD